MVLKPVLLMVLACGAGLMGSVVRPADAAAFVCPETVTADAPKNASALSDLAESRIGDLVADLRKNGMKPALIVDSLVAAYCPRVASDASLSDAQKADLVRRFARQVTGVAFGQPGQGELDVLVDVPLAPNLLRQVEQAAAGAGMSRDAWIERAIKQQLAIP